MKILFACDSYKEFASSKEVGKLIQIGLSASVESKVISISDGGEGFLDSISENIDGEFISCKVFDPIMRYTFSKYFKSNSLAIIEFSEACGVQKFNSGERHFINSSSYGVGQLIKNAIDNGCKEIVVGLGGAATGEAGIGAAQALGIQFIDSNGNELKNKGLSLKDLPKIFSADFVKLKNKLKDTKFKIVSDVTNPSIGKFGATYTYGPQKGAKNHHLKKIENYIKNYALNVLELKNEFLNMPGTGAAGAFALSMNALFDLKIEPGISFVMDKINFLRVASDYDIIITGEGSFDQLSLNGKAPVYIAKMGRKLGKKVVGIFGQVKLQDAANEIFDVVINTSKNKHIDMKSDHFRNVEAKKRLTEAGKKIESILKN
tara:strand:+ start:6195 stop:7319 length:1125 start_codon:yes stop_codon:yes gene_type:complete